MSLLPAETLATLSNINESLKKLTKAVKDFSTINFDAERSPNDQAQIYLTAMYTTTALGAINEKLQGKLPGENDELQTEIKRVEKRDKQLNDKQDEVLQRRLDRFAAKTCIRTALVGVNQTRSSNNNNNAGKDTVAKKPMEENNNVPMKEEGKTNDA